MNTPSTEHAPGFASADIRHDTAGGAVALLSALLDGSGDAIMAITADGLVNSWNAAAEKLLVYESAEILGRPVALLLTPEAAAQQAAAAARVLSGEKVAAFVCRCLRRDGRQIELCLSMMALRDAHGHVCGLVQVLRDVGVPPQAQLPEIARMNRLDQLRLEEESRLAEAQVRHERDFSDAMLASLPGVFYLFDESGRFLRWNDNFERVTGYSAEEMAHKHPLDFFQGEDRGRVAARIAEVFRTGESSIEAGLLAKNGRVTPYEFTGVKTCFEGRNCLIGVGMDISARLREEAARRASEASYRTLFEYAPDGIVIADGSSRYLDANPSMCRLLGLSRDELIGLHASDIVVPGEQQQIGPALDAIHSRSGYQREWQFRRRDGSVFPADVIATMMPDGNLMGLVRDISDRKHAERQLQEAHAVLEQKVADRTAELQAALKQAESADRIKSAFLATMSHELRTPLNSIIGFTGMVLQGLAGPLNAEQSKQLGMVRGSARHLLELINDVLDLSKIEAGQLQLRAEVFDLPALIERVVASLQPLAARRSLTLDTMISPGLGQMCSDSRRVGQILLNLLNNAIKFTERGGVLLTAERSGPDVVCLRVTDTGIGIGQDDMATLFQPFRQVDTGLTRQHDGTGLGLAICRRLADLLGGTISAESQAARGSTFTVMLPLEMPLEKPL